MIAAVVEAIGPEPSSPEAPPSLAPGAILAPGYRVLAHLRRGGSLDVYEVWSEERACRCVAKVLRPDRIGDAAAQRRLLHEGRLLVRLRHPHIVRAYEVFDRPLPSVILETVGGATLERLLQDERFAPVEIISVGLHLCSALHYLHGHGVLHLDLKPSNIVSDRGLARLLDFDIARAPGQGRRGVGTRYYMAPEQARGERLTTAADVWGIGVVLYEVASGRNPFLPRPGDPKYPQLARRAEPVRRRRRRLPAALAEAIDRALEPDAALRPTITELSRLLRRAGGLPPDPLPPLC